MIWIRVTVWKLIAGVWIIACGWSKSSGKLARKWTKKRPACVWCGWQRCRSCGPARPRWGRGEIV